MSLLLEFYAGKAEAIGKAVTAGEYKDLRNGNAAHAYANFTLPSSLHISLTELDILSEQIAGIMKHEPIRLLESLERNVGGFEEESSADVVSSEWVNSIAVIPVEQVAELSRIWLSAVMCEIREELDVDNAEAARALQELVSLCQKAKARGSEVVFAWLTET